VSRTERAKGARGELEIAHILRAAGWPNAKRTSDGRAQTQRGDIADGPAGVHLEVRRRETLALWAWLAQAEREAREGDVPVVVFRRSHSRWYAAVPLDDLLDLLADRDTLEARQ
jgi:hypothetical protein